MLAKRLCFHHLSRAPEPDVLRPDVAQSSSSMPYVRRVVSTTGQDTGHNSKHLSISRSARISLINDRTFGTPSLGYLEGRLVVSSANGRCSGSGRHAIGGSKSQKHLSFGSEKRSLTLQIPQATVHSSLVADA